jgi:hypothetical protein
MTYPRERRVSQGMKSRRVPTIIAVTAKGRTRMKIELRRLVIRSSRAMTDGSPDAKATKAGPVILVCAISSATYWSIDRGVIRAKTGVTAEVARGVI